MRGGWVQVAVLAAVLTGALCDAGLAAAQAAAGKQAAVRSAKRRASDGKRAAGVTIARRLAAMGTWLDVEVNAADRQQALAASEMAVSAVVAAENRLSTWRPETELARLNQRAQPAVQPAAATALSPELARELGDALTCAARTEGAFDPTVGPLIQAWGLRGQARVPAEAELAAALARVGYAQVRLQDGKLQQLRPDIVWEEGGFGKGAGLDRALQAWQRAGIQQGSVDLGGQVAWLGRDRTVLIAHPHHRDQPVVRLTLPPGSVATSGNSEHGQTVAGTRIGHLLDPRTGRPAPDFGSVTVWAQNAQQADCLSTALFVMGPAKALAFAAANRDNRPASLDPAWGPFEVLVLQTAGDKVEIRYSAGLDGRVHELARATKGEK